jgi:hypothetical protein
MAGFSLLPNAQKRNGNGLLQSGSNDLIMY